MFVVVKGGGCCLTYSHGGEMWLQKFQNQLHNIRYEAMYKSATMYFCGRKSFKVQEGQKPQARRSNAVDDDDADNENISCLTSLKSSINPA